MFHVFWGKNPTSETLKIFAAPIRCQATDTASADTVEDPAKALLAEQDPAKALAEKEADGNDPQLQLEMVSLRCHCVFLLGTWEDWRLRCVILIWIWSILLIRMYGMVRWFGFYESLYSLLMFVGWIDSMTSEAPQIVPLQQSPRPWMLQSWHTRFRLCCDMVCRCPMMLKAPRALLDEHAASVSLSIGPLKVTVFVAVAVLCPPGQLPWGDFLCQEPEATAKLEAEHGNLDVSAAHQWRGGDGNQFTQPLSSNGCMTFCIF